MDVPGSKELHDRIRKQLISQGVVEPTEEEAQELQVEQLKQQQMAQQLQQELLVQLQNDSQVRRFFYFGYL